MEPHTAPWPLSGWEDMGILRISMCLSKLHAHTIPVSFTGVTGTSSYTPLVKRRANSIQCDFDYSQRTPSTCLS